MKFIWYNIILSFMLNWLICPIAYIFRKKLKSGFLWWFLTDNLNGDKTWRPKLKHGFVRSYLWMLRNPLQNYYWKDYIDGTESDFTGIIKVKFGEDLTSWRTGICSDTGDWHGKILDFESPKLGYQDIKFIRTDKNGNVQQCFRKSKCVPFRFLWWIFLAKSRSGHESGLMQYNFTFPKFSYKDNKAGFEMWKKKQWYIVVKQ